MKLDVNARVHEVDADPATPLLYVLREDLQLNGAKFGCGLGQCGACIAGMMMRAQALLDRKPNASEAEIRTALQPNLCRCGTHLRIVRAAVRAGELMRGKS